MVVRRWIMEVEGWPAARKRFASNTASYIRVYVYGGGGPHVNHVVMFT